MGTRYQTWDDAQGGLVAVSDEEGLRAERDFWKANAEMQHRWVHRLEDTIAELRAEIDQLRQTNGR